MSAQRWDLKLTQILSLKVSLRDFPGGPVVKIPRFHCRGHGFHPWSGKYAAWPGQKKNSRKFSEKPSNPFTQFFTWGIKPEECWWAFVPRHCRLDWGRAGTTYISCLGGATPALCSEAVSGGKWVIWLLYLVSILIRFPCNLESIFSFILFGVRRVLF